MHLSLRLLRCLVLNVGLLVGLRVLQAAYEGLWDLTPLLLSGGMRMGELRSRLMGLIWLLLLLCHKKVLNLGQSLHWIATTITTQRRSNITAAEASCLSVSLILIQLVGMVVEHAKKFGIIHVLSTVLLLGLLWREVAHLLVVLMVR